MEKLNKLDLYDVMTIGAILLVMDGLLLQNWIGIVIPIILVIVTKWNGHLAQRLEEKNHIMKLILAVLIFLTVGIALVDEIQKGMYWLAPFLAIYLVYLAYRIITRKKA